MARGRPRLPRGEAGHVPAVGGGPRRLRHRLPDRLAGLRRDRRHSQARHRGRAGRGGHGPALRAPLRRHRRGHPALGPRHRLLAHDRARARPLAALPLQPRPGPGRHRVRGQRHAPRPAGTAALLRRARHRGRDRGCVGPLPGPHPGDRGAGLGQVHPAGRRHQAAAGARRRPHPVLRGADRIRLRRHRHRHRADVLGRDPQALPELCRRLALVAAAPACGGRGGRGAGPRDRRGGGARSRLRHRRVLHRAHHRRRRHRAPPAGRVPGARARGTGRCAGRRHDPGGDAGAAAQPELEAAPRCASGSYSTPASRRRCWRARRRAGRRGSRRRWRGPATRSRPPPGAPTAGG